MGEEPTGRLRSPPRRRRLLGIHPQRARAWQRRVLYEDDGSPSGISAEGRETPPTHPSAAGQAPEKAVTRRQDPPAERAATTPQHLQRPHYGIWRVPSGEGRGGIVGRAQHWGQKCALLVQITQDGGLPHESKGGCLPCMITFHVK